MSKVFVSVTMSLDGFLAPEQRSDDVGDKRWFAQWMEMQRYAVRALTHCALSRDGRELG